MLTRSLLIKALVMAPDEALVNAFVVACIPKTYQQQFCLMDVDRLPHVSHLPKSHISSTLEGTDGPHVAFSFTLRKRSESRCEHYPIVDHKNSLDPYPNSMFAFIIGEGLVSSGRGASR